MPYFKKWNIHFYVNRCGFYIVEFLNEHFPDVMFRFEMRVEE